MGRLLSGRVGVTSYAGLSTHRNQTNGFPSFLGLNEAEPSLGLPSNNEFILYANTTGERFWAAPPSGTGGGSAFGITVQDQSVTPVGFAGSTTRVNFVGNGVFVTEAKENTGVGGTIQIGVSTVHIQKNQLDFEDANDFTRNTGITTIRVGIGLSLIAVPVVDNRSGLASLFFWIMGISIIGANRAGIFLHLMPIMGAIMAMLIFNERFMFYHILGAIFIIAGITLSNRKKLNA